MNESLRPALAALAALVSEWRAPCALVGGLAMVLRARPRLTRDVDLVITVPEGSSGALLEAARRHGFAYDEQETRTFVEGGLVRLWFTQTPGAPRQESVGVDLLFANDALSESVVARAQMQDFDGIRLPVATAEDLLLMKLDANRPTDLDDALALKDVFGESLDRDYIERWAAQLDLTKRVEALLGPGK